MSKDTATGCNIYTKGQDPALGKDEDYPDWLWTLLEPPKTAKQLHQAAALAGSYDSLPDAEFFRLAKLERKVRIKAHNAANSKSK